MKDKYKILLVKFSILLSAILGIMLLVSAFKLEVIDESNLLYKYYERQTILFFALTLLSTIIMIILMLKIDIQPIRTKSKKFKLKISNYNELKDKLFTKLIDDGYDNNQSYKDELYEIDYVIKEKYNNTYIFAIMKLEEMTNEIYELYKENYFEDFGIYLIENNQINPKYDINLTYIICVDKVTPIFSKYTEGNVKQYFGRYILPVGVSFSSNTLYIATQKEGYAKTKYNSLFRKFKLYMNEFIENKDKFDK